MLATMKKAVFLHARIGGKMEESKQRQYTQSRERGHGGKSCCRQFKTITKNSFLLFYPSVNGSKSLQHTKFLSFLLRLLFLLLLQMPEDPHPVRTHYHPRRCRRRRNRMRASKQRQSQQRSGASPPHQRLIVLM